MLHERIAQTLGWTVEQARTFSMYALRDLVRPVDAALADEITAAIEAERQFILGFKFSRDGSKRRRSW